jgi:hypothetical protein
MTRDGRSDPDHGHKPVGVLTLNKTLAQTLGLIALTTAGAAAGTEQLLSMVGSGHTADWNPVNTHSYPALLVSRLICERLYERRCMSLKENRITNVIARCQSPYEQAGTGGVRLDLSVQECGAKDGIPLSPQDVRYTLAAIQAAPASEYRLYDIQLTVAGVLRLGDSDLGTGASQVQKLDFPLLRRTATRDPADFAAMQVDVGQIADINAQTAGPFKVADITPERIRLERRRAGKQGLGAIEITELALDLDKLDVLQRSDPPDVVLAVPESFPYPQSVYNARQSEDLMSFTYIGFNFAHPSFQKTNPPRQRDLIDSQEFRELFTRSIWALEVVQEKVGSGRYNVQTPGIFIGESFDPNLPDSPTLLPPAELRQRIKTFLQEQRLSKHLELRMLISIAVGRHFSRSEIDALLLELGSYWTPPGVVGLRFKPDKRGTPREFAKARAAGGYHLLFDDLVYGRNRRKPIAFVDPSQRDGENFLGIDIYKPRQIKRWLESGLTGRQEARREIAKQFPVAVVGFFPSRDLFSNAIQRPGVSCGTAQPLPYFDIPNWTVGP